MGAKSRTRTSTSFWGVKFRLQSGSESRSGPRSIKVQRMALGACSRTSELGGMVITFSSIRDVPAPLYPRCCAGSGSSQDQVGLLFTGGVFYIAFPGHCCNLRQCLRCFLPAFTVGVWYSDKTICFLSENGNCGVVLSSSTSLQVTTFSFHSFC